MVKSVTSSFSTSSCATRLSPKKKGVDAMISDLKCILPKDKRTKFSKSSIADKVAILNKVSTETGIKVYSTAVYWLKLKYLLVSLFSKKLAVRIQKQIRHEEIAVTHRKFFGIKRDFESRAQRLYGVSFDYSDDILSQIRQKILITHESESSLPQISKLKASQKKGGMIQLLKVLNEKMTEIEERHVKEFNKLLRKQGINFKVKIHKDNSIDGIKQHLLNPLGYTKKGGFRNYSEVDALYKSCGLMGVMQTLSYQLEAFNTQAKAIKKVFQNLDDGDCFDLVCKQEKMRDSVLGKTNKSYSVKSNFNQDYSYQLKTIESKHNENQSLFVEKNDLKNHLNQAKNIDDLVDDPTDLFEDMRTRLNLTNDHAKELINELETLKSGKAIVYKTKLFEIKVRSTSTGFNICKFTRDVESKTEILIKEVLDSDSETSQISGGFKVYTPSMTVNDGKKRAHLVLRSDKCKKENDAKTFDKDTKILKTFIEKGIKQVPNLLYSNTETESTYENQFTVLENLDVDGKDYYRKRCKNLDRNTRVNNFHKIAQELSEGLLMIHDSDHLLIDIKPRNVMFNLNENNEVVRVVFIDFGLVKDLTRYEVDADGNIKVQSGTEGYQAPEVADDNVGKGHKPLDIFSLGLTLAEIRYRGKLITDTLVKKMSDGEIEDSDIQGALKRVSGKTMLDTKLDKFLLRMLKVDPTDRPTAKEVYEFFLKSNPM